MFTLGDLSVMNWYEWWNGTLFTHCTEYYLRVELGKRIKVKGKGNLLEILKVSYCDKLHCVVVNYNLVYYDVCELCGAYCIKCL